MSNSNIPHVQLSDRFITAVAYATALHRNQTRKSTANPYICHPLGVASLIIEVGGDEDQAIAGLLHDIAEDCGGESRLKDIEEMFGKRVSLIVRGCSDSLLAVGEEKAEHGPRKEAHLNHLRLADADILLVTAADKLHNARAIVMDLQTEGNSVWDRFSAGREYVIGYYNSIFQILVNKGITPKLLKPLEISIKFMEGGN